MALCYAARFRHSSSVYLHELEGSFKVFHRVHFDAEKLESHDEADGGLDDVRALLFLPQLLELGDELLSHCWEPAKDMVTRCEQLLSGVLVKAFISMSQLGGDYS